MHDIVIKNGLCFVGGEFIECCVGIKGDRISYIGYKDEEGEIEFDASNCYVLPGMFNSHTHAAMTILRGYAEGLPLRSWLERVWEAEAKMDGEDVYWATMLACVEMLKTGTTCFADMYIHMDEVAKAVVDSGIRAVLGYGMADRGDEERAREEIETGSKFVSEWNWASDGRIKCMLTPHSPYTCSPEFLKEVDVISKKLGVVKHIHVSETKWEVDETSKLYGKTPVKLLNEIGFLDDKTVIAHAVWVDEEEMEILALKGVSVAHCPSSNLKLASGIAPVKEMVKKSINVCIGTDGAASNNNLNMFLETRLAALLQLYRGMVDVTDFLRMASENGYKAYDVDGGRLEVGRLADVIVVERKAWHHPLYDARNSLLFASNGSEVRHVIVNGELIVEDGILLTVDEEQVLRKVEERAEKFR